MDKKTLNLVQGKKYFLNGVEKTQWIKIGKLFTKMDIPSSVKLDALPLPMIKVKYGSRYFLKIEKKKFWIHRMQLLKMI